MNVHTVMQYISRKLGPLMLGASFLTAAGCAGGPQKESRSAPRPQQADDIAPPPAETPAAPVTNAGLLQAALDDLDGIIARHGSSYSRDIRRKQEEMNTGLRHDPNPFIDHIIVMDIEKMSIAYALTGGEEKFGGIVRRELALQGYPLAPEAGIDDAAREVLPRLAGIDLSPYHYQDIYAAKPYGAARREARTCIIIPANAGNLTFRISGTSMPDNIEFIYEHEESHCLNPKYDLNSVNDFFREYKVDKDGKRGAFIDNMTQMHDSEIIADGVALVRRALAGAGMEIFDKLAKKRREELSQDIGSFVHDSSHAMLALKKDIEKNGLTELAGMNNEALHAHVGKVISAASPLSSPGVAEAFVFSDPARSISAREIAMGKALRDKFFSASGPAPEKDLAVLGVLWGMDVLDSLADEAAARFQGRVTPETVIASYNAIQDSLRAQIEQSPDAPLPAEIAARYRTIMMTELPKIDFVGESLKHGVDLNRAHPPLPPALRR